MQNNRNIFTILVIFSQFIFMEMFASNLPRGSHRKPTLFEVADTNLFMAEIWF